jgi:uncharacterized protein (UPF0261 family)
MKRRVSIVVIATLDTKGREVVYVRDQIRRHGADALVLDAGILGSPEGLTAHIAREEVAAATGGTLAEIQGAGSRGAAVERMCVGVRLLCHRLWLDGKLDGVLCIGGAEGALLGAAGMQVLPLGVPKLIVTPSASGRRQFGAFVGESDILMMHSVVDILGLNAIARSVFDNAVAAIVAMARKGGGAVSTIGSEAVGITMLGNTTPGVVRLRAVLEDSGQQTVIFHANGVGGVAMERLAASGALTGVIDYTLAELSNTQMDGVLAASSERLQILGRCSLPRVVVPGCVDFFNSRAPLPERWRSRRTYLHNPISILVRLGADEMRQVAGTLAERLNASVGPVRVVLPAGGLSMNDVPGGALWDPAADAAFAETLEASLRPGIPFERIDRHVNDPLFATQVAERYLELSASVSHRELQ